MMVFKEIIKKAVSFKDPKAPKISPEIQNIPNTFDKERTDSYAFLEDLENPKTLNYLRAENLYARKVMKNTAILQKKLYSEIQEKNRSSIQSVSEKIGGYFYYWRYQKDKQHPLYFRQKDSFDEPEELILNLNKREGRSVKLGVFKISPDGRYLAYSIDTDGGERFTIYIKDLEKGITLEEEIPDSYYTLEWFNDSSRFVYTVLDKKNRPYRAYTHKLFDLAHQDKLVYEEKDEKLFLIVSKTTSDSCLILSSRIIRGRSRFDKEIRIINADKISSRFNVLIPRTSGQSFIVEHDKDNSCFVVLFYDSNKRKDGFFQLDEEGAKSEFKCPAYDNISIENFFVFRKYNIGIFREDGLLKIRVFSKEKKEFYDVSFDEEVYSIVSSTDPIDNAGELPLNHRFDTDNFRFIYSSPITPQSIFDINLENGEKTLVSQRVIEGGYRRDKYEIKRIKVPATDNKQVLVSIYQKRGLEKDGENPLVLYAYGAYGLSYSTDFSPSIFSLLDRGVIVAVAHIRGGGEGGREWYENGRLLKKKNSINDFISCTEFLIEKKYTKAKKIIAGGYSAGGVVMGAIANMRPDLFLGIVMEAPFVDVLSTMLNKDLPLTITEYTEWGNPEDKKFYDYIKSYSPYDNVGNHEYPNMLLTAGLNDPRVSYFEPAKFTAKIREMRTDNNIILFETDMEAGHSGASGRFEEIKETAHIYSFMLMLFGINK